MEKEELLNYKKQLLKLSKEEKKLRDLYLRKLALDEILGPQTEYSSIEKPWLQYYEEEHITNELPYMTAHEYLEKLNKNNMNQLAIDAIDGKYTYSELIETYHNAAKSLYAMDTKKGKTSLFVIPPMAMESILLYATSILGASITGLSVRSTIDEICIAINKLNVDKLFIIDGLLNEANEKIIYQKTNVKNIIVYNFSPLSKHDNKTITWNEFMKKGKNIILPEIESNPEDTLFIAQTGGSTGTPQSVNLSSNSFNIIVHQCINSNLNYNKGDKWLRLWELFSATAAVSNNHMPLCIGMETILRIFPVNIDEFDKLVVKEKPNHLMIIPQLLDVLEKSELFKNEDTSYIKSIGCGGMSITSSFEKRAQKLFNKQNLDIQLGYGWGLTENAGAATIRSDKKTTKIGTVGSPLVKTTIAAFDPIDLNEKSYDEEGELCIQSESIMKGYYNNEDLTNRSIKTHDDGSKWLHTGDLGSISPNGLVTINGRMTETIFTLTAKLYVSEIENIIAKATVVCEVAVCKIPDQDHEGFFRPVCFIVPKEGFNKEDVKKNVDEICAINFSDYTKPSKIYIVDYFPLLKSGKANKKLLLEQAMAEETLIRKKAIK
jgi:long-chain acyl-CoA synthetase